MVSKQNSLLLEPVSHETQSLPISFHHTKVEAYTELILYLHWHNEIEFFYIIQGETIFVIEEQEYYLIAGDAIFVPPNLLHMAKSLNGSECEFHAIVFSPTYLFDSYMDPHYTKYLLPIKNYSLRCPLHLEPSTLWQKNILNMIKNMYSLSLLNPEQWELQMKGLLLQIWQLLYNNHLSKIEISNNISRLAVQLDSTIDYIHSSYNDTITLKRLASSANLSEGQFCRLFKLLTGMTPFNYINRYRIIKSCEYLSSTTKKVAEIATLCGFNNISYYNREFIRYIKMSPSAYRKTVLH